jgi:hypothetical protein
MENPDGYRKGRFTILEKYCFGSLACNTNEIVDLGVMVLQKLLQQL